MSEFTVEQIKKGDVPWQPFQFVSVNFIVPGCVNSTTLGMIAKIADPASRTLTMDKAMSVIIACQAINRMMGRSINQGMYGENQA